MVAIIIRCIDMTLNCFGYCIGSPSHRDELIMEHTHLGILNKAHGLDEITGNSTGAQNTPSNDGRGVVVAVVIADTTDAAKVAPASRCRRCRRTSKIGAECE